jgi:hypothetical protein
MLQKADPFLAVKKNAQIYQILLHKSLNAVAHAVKRSDVSAVNALLHAAYHACKRCVNGGGGASALTYDRISKKLFVHVFSSFPWKNSKKIYSLTVYHKVAFLSIPKRQK